MDHFKILKRAFHITWKYRALWLVGLLLVLAGGGVLNSSSAGSSGSAPSSSSRNTSPEWEGWQGREPAQVWAQIAPIVITIAILIAALFLLILLISLIKIAVRPITRVSLIQMVDSYEETGEEMGVMAGLRLGWSRSALNLFLTNLMLRLPLTLLVLALIIPIVILSVFSFINGSGAAIATGVILLLLIIPIILLSVVIGAVLGPIIELAYRVCVIDRMGPWAAIKESVGLIRRNFGATALQWLLLAGLGIAYGLVMIPVNILLVFLALFVSALPALLFGGLVSMAVGWPWGLGLGILAAIPLLFIIVGLPNLALKTLATVFHSTTWTLTFRELRVIDRGDPTSELEDLDEIPAESFQ